MEQDKPKIQDDPLDHPLFSDGLPKNFQTNAAFLGLAHLDDVELHPSSSSQQPHRAVSLPQANSPSFTVRGGPVRRARSSQVRKDEADPYGGKQRLRYRITFYINQYD